MDGTNFDSPTEISDTIQRPDRGPVRRALFDLKRWFLLEANRWTVVGLLAASTFLLTVLVGTFGPVSTHRFLTRGISPASALVELLKAIVSVVTIVLSVNQLVLSPELGPVSDQRERLEDTMDLRSRSESLLDETVSPLAPSQFLEDLVSALKRRAVNLGEAADGSPELRGEVADFTRDVLDDANAVEAKLADAEFGDFETVPAVMDFDTSSKIRRLRRIRRAYDDALADEEAEAVSEMVDALELFATARAYLKTTYIRTEFINFSRALLYLGFPSLLLTYFAAQIYDSGVFPNETLGVENQLLFVAGAVTVSLIPVMTLVSYISRLATVSQSTLFIGPFVAGSERGGDD